MILLRPSIDDWIVNEPMTFLVRFALAELLSVCQVLFTPLGYRLLSGGYKVGQEYLDLI